MDKKIKIIIDAMGGDNAPEAIIAGAAAACRELEDIYCILVGNQTAIRDLLKTHPLPEDRFEIVHASQVITMDEVPKEAVEEKTDASINVAARLIAEEKGDAMISAGNTGATILACSKVIPRMPGIERAALAAVFPVMKQQRSDPGRSIMLDVGATLHCSTNQLVSFAIMGMQYAKNVMEIENPRVGLLNIGEEETKGHEVLVETHRLLKKMHAINFIGNVEGKDVLQGYADVIVTEGYVGNIVLKALEGVGEIVFTIAKQIWNKNLMSKMGLTLLSPVLKKIKRRVDYTEYGGAPILGFNRLIIKSHGRSNDKAIKNAIHLAHASVKNQLVEKMEKSIKDFYLLMLEGSY